MTPSGYLRGGTESVAPDAVFRVVKCLRLSRTYSRVSAIGDWPRRMKRATAALIARWITAGVCARSRSRSAEDSSAPSPARPVFRKNSSSVSRRIAGAFRERVRARPLLFRTGFEGLKRTWLGWISVRGADPKGSSRS